ncbi:MAG TPA: hypothetical protein VN703_09650 [Candidatus Sulfopaludibacter sp.]|nr:hypothetical protein [Candidatus Sulfopaludibacter sp.]
MSLICTVNAAAAASFPLPLHLFQLYRLFQTMSWDESAIFR